MQCAAENIKQYANQSQFVIMLREPLMRLYSNFEMSQAWGWEKNTDLLDVVNSQVRDLLIFKTQPFSLFFGFEDFEDIP